MIDIVCEQLPQSSVKLKKPKELKGIEPLFSVRWGGSKHVNGVACQVFVQGYDVWVKHNDWCSVVLHGREARHKRCFVYSDGFTAPVVRGKAWIRLTGVLKLSPVSAIRQVNLEAIDTGSRFCCDDVRMFEDIIVKLRNKED